MILDEPTAAFDGKSELEFYTNLKKGGNDNITIIISHRLAVVSLCNKIIYLEKGVIKECGSHDDLMKKMEIMQVCIKHRNQCLNKFMLIQMAIKYFREIAEICVMPRYGCVSKSQPDILALCNHVASNK